MIKEEENEASSPLDQAALAKKEEGEVLKCPNYDLFRFVGDIVGSGSRTR